MCDSYHYIMSNWRKKNMKYIVNIEEIKCYKSATLLINQYPLSVIGKKRMKHKKINIIVIN